MQENNCHYVNKNLEFTKLSMHHFEKMFVNFFYAPKYAQTEQFIESLRNISCFYSEAIYIFIDIEKCPDLVKVFEISMIPTIILSDANKKILKRLENPQSNELILTLEDDIALFKTNFELEKKRMFNKIENILSINPIMVFIKGTPQEPKCGFTSTLLDIIQSFGLNFGYFNILEDEDVRNWLRYYAKWNTYPQLHINKKIVGGVDFVKDLVSKGKFEEILPLNSRKSDPKSKLFRLLNECKGKILIFIKDLINNDTKTMVRLMKDNGVKFILNEVKNDEKLEEFILETYKVKALPVCFIKGEFIGDSHVIKEICQSNKLLKMVPDNEWSLNSKQKFDYLINNFNVICFIEGNYEDKEKLDNVRLFEILRKNEINFEYFNVLFDNDVKEILLNYTKFKGFPQVIRKGKLLGGLELMEEIEKQGEIKNLFK